jgi:hypothetical protein
VKRQVVTHLPADVRQLGAAAASGRPGSNPALPNSSRVWRSMA